MVESTRVRSKRLSFSGKKTLSSFMQVNIASLRQSGKLRTSETYRATLNSFMKFMDGKDVLLSNMDAELMMGYETYLKEQGASMNTVSFYMRILRATYNRAVDKGVIRQRFPFKHVYTGVEKTVKRAISFKVIRQLKEMDLSHSQSMEFARDMFMFSFYTRGMSFVDMAFLKKTDLNNGMLTYRRKKTGQLLSIRWEKCMQDIVDKYPGNYSTYLLPIIIHIRKDERLRYKTVNVLFVMLNTLLLIGGLALILAGANGLTDGSAAVAKRFRISDLVIGLTIVAFGTSAPELVISVLSALNGSAEMAIGNVVGSNIFNALMIIGCTALVLPIKVGEGTMSKEIPLVILSSLVLFVCANDMMLDREAVNVISRSDGFVLLAFFLIFMRYTFAIARNGADEAGEEQKIKEMPVWKSVLYIAGGLAGLIFGGQLFVDGASGLARSWGVSESVIGLTLVAGGTSLPELATSVTAALKKNPGIAIGNVIGSNLFNIFFVLGCSATVSPLPMGNINNLDLSVLIASSLLLWLVGWFFRKRTITRLEGALMVGCYVVYTAYLIAQQ